MHPAMKRRRGRPALLMAVTALIATLTTAVQANSPALTNKAATAIAPVGTLATERAAHQATLLPSGELLISGGCSGNCEQSLNSSERYDPVQKRFRPAATMQTARSGHGAVALADGRVLIVGGWSNGRVTNSAELYDPEQDRFASLEPMPIARAGAAVATLPDGRVLIAGGQTSQFEPIADAEIFDPATSRFHRVSAMTEARMNHVAVSLQDGRVLLIGGKQSRRGETLRSAELFHPDRGRFQATGMMQIARHKHAAARLPDGRVLVLGGADARDQQGRYRSSEIYDPATGSFAMGPAMQWPRFKIMHALVTLADGSLLIAGGAQQLERFLPQQQRFEPLPGMLELPPSLATASVLPNGEVLLVGGYGDNIRSIDRAWLITPPH